MLLTLDPGTALAYTLGPVDRDAPISAVEIDTITLKGKGLGAFLGSADDPVRTLLRRGVTHVAIEVPNTTQGFHSSIIKLVPLFGHVFYLCHLLGMKEPTVFSPKELKTVLCGSGNAKKPEMYAAARAMGWPVETHDQADAVALRKAFLEGVPMNKTERQKAEAAQRKAEREAKKGPKLL